MTTTEKKTYNGWTNYETWNVALWIGNEEGSYRYWQAVTQECYDEATAPSVNARLTGKERHRYTYFIRNPIIILTFDESSTMMIL